MSSSVATRPGRGERDIDPVRQEDGLLDVVGHHEDGGAEGAPDLEGAVAGGRWDPLEASATASSGWRILFATGRNSGDYEAVCAETDGEDYLALDQDPCRILNGLRAGARSKPSSPSA